ncbi:polysaccharide pyruvyl transferase family protein [Pseudophaeobacter flagellatus]|uniref:polysaccharide pyruvyl transferase family protein n=1 Tax=Pseudophaeobacter flagellatus TaxID=2899119 RepID=UPI001E288BE3|nr:polysaccharide pyruvyl transferase family protein [Pseudophaeobacter flagellatus]MCD9150008.1 polysaccharide pyruvyl transferase family protein [Pseudophaeobacter flagellatus]
MRLFWWKAVPNFGDALSSSVVAHLSGRDVVHTGPGKADIFATGSILQIARRKYSEVKTYAQKPVIWGSGLLHAVSSLGFLSNVNIALLRGPVSASLLGIKTEKFGDPGLLVAEIFAPAPSKTHRIGLVPHHSQMADPEIQSLADSSEEILLIDPSQAPATVCRQISACGHIYAASLHGLITADAYGVASTWVSPGDQGHLKYYDYAASIGRVLISPLSWDQIPDHARATQQPADLPYAAGIRRAQADLRHSFPACLRAQQTLAVPEPARP